IELNIEGSTKTFNITENINNLKEIIKENRNNIIKKNYERISEEGSEEISGNDQMEIDFEENLSEELSELEDELPKVNKKRKHEKEKEENKRKSKKRISDKTAKSKLYEEMKEQIIGNITRITLRKRTHRAMKIYNLFKEIGTEKINRFRDCTVETVIRLTKE